MTPEQQTLISVPAAHRDAEDGTGASDHWFTPLWLFRPLHKEFGFTCDVAGNCAAPVTLEIKRFFGIDMNGLSKSWADERCWLNPPYSEIEPWARKALNEVAREGSCPLVVMLVPATKTEQPWWQECVEPWRDRGQFSLNGGRTAARIQTRFLPKRFKFGSPGDPHGERGQSPQFGCVLVIWKRVTP